MKTLIQVLLVLNIIFFINNPTLPILIIIGFVIWVYDSEYRNNQLTDFVMNYFKEGK